MIERERIKPWITPGFVGLICNNTINIKTKIKDTNSQTQKKSKKKKSENMIEEWNNEYLDTNKIIWFVSHMDSAWNVLSQFNCFTIKSKNKKLEKKLKFV
jgi:gamma-glutamyl phosphate reductase